MHALPIEFGRVWSFLRLVVRCNRVVRSYFLGVAMRFLDRNMYVSIEKYYFV